MPHRFKTQANSPTRYASTGISDASTPEARKPTRRRIGNEYVSGRRDARDQRGEHEHCRQDLPARPAPTRPRCSGRRRRTPRGTRHAIRNGWPSSHALHGAESNTRARNAAPSATAPTTYHAQYETPGGPARSQRARSRKHHTARDEAGLVRIADPHAPRQVFEHLERRRGRRRITGRGNHRHR